MEPVNVTRASEMKQHKAFHGLYRSLINNMVTGRNRRIQDPNKNWWVVGYKAEVNGQILELNLGFSHNIYIQVPSEINVSAETVKGKNPGDYNGKPRQTI